MECMNDLVTGIFALIILSAVSLFLAQWWEDGR